MQYGHGWLPRRRGEYFQLLTDLRIATSYSGHGGSIIGAWMILASLTSPLSSITSSTVHAPVMVRRTFESGRSIEPLFFFGGVILAPVGAGGIAALSSDHVVDHAQLIGIGPAFARRRRRDDRETPTAAQLRRIFIIALEAR